MEDHFILFPILVMIGIIKAAILLVKLAYFLIAFVFVLIKRMIDKKKNRRGVNDYVDR
ncbi:hypothetical protein [Clostridium estertheticum]|uniref:hypothetical protein n=1 Tax=Clostridium estertheticum TaxID=238834 RepID=UPI001C0B78FF|nr:hypothetical protein [Clostridium estertheticum]MBU3186598.1 hypothetical protein [Clostridium estertheticum]